jgi:DNA-binding NarL/FixJ family response regulator
MTTDRTAPFMPRKHKVLIVDDHPIVRKGFTELISREPDLEVCGEAGDGPEALERYRETSPDVIILDLSLGTGHGLDVIEQIRAENERVKMLVSSAHDESLFAERVLRAGAAGYLDKREALENIVYAVRQVLRGEIYLSARMANRFLHGAVPAESLEQDPLKTLSNREMEVFEMIGGGLSTQQIASRLQLSPKTVETHRDRIKTKLNVKNTNELVRLAFQWSQENC